MRLATWNVNSIRARAERVVSWLERTQTDVLAVQETKCKDAQFPVEAFTEAGYEVAAFGLNQWNGVAIISRVGLEDVQRTFANQPAWGDPPVVEARAMSALCGTTTGPGVRVWSLYIPNGRAVTDPHYAYKLEWLAKLHDASESWLDGSDERVALVGDWNVAPTDADVWDMAAFEGATHVTEAERAAFRAFATLGYEELVTPRNPGPGVYTYWDYQQLRFPRNEGMRIDFAYASPALARAVTTVTIDRNERKGKGASDHVPIIIDIENAESTAA